MPITRTPIHDDDGSGTTGTVLDNAWKQELYNQIDSLGGGERLNQNGAGAVTLSPAYGTHIISLVPGAGANALTWSGGTGQDGERLVLLNIGGAGYHALATVGGVQNFVSSAPMPIARGGAATYTRTAGGWYMTSYEQGVMIAAPYNAAAFIASAGAWTVDAGDMASFTYRLAGTMLTVAWTLNATSVTAAPSSLIILNTAYGGFTAASGTQVTAALSWVLDANTPITGGGYTTAAAAAQLALFKGNNTAWTASTNATYVYGQITFPVA